MATITPKLCNGKPVSFRFRACVGRDQTGKQVFRSTTWKVPLNSTQSRIERMARREAEKWEREVKIEYEKDLQNPDRVKTRIYCVIFKLQRKESRYETANHLQQSDSVFE